MILAAGQGRRLGGPKALLRWPFAGGAPLAAAHARALTEADLHAVVVVTRAAVSDKLRPYLPPSATLVVSDAPDDWGPAGSIAAAVATVGVTRPLLITPVDARPVAGAVVRALFDALTDPAVDAARPMFQGRRGHPVLLAPSALDAYARVPPPILREHLRRLRCVDVAVEEASILVDLDTVDDVAAVTGCAPEFV